MSGDPLHPIVKEQDVPATGNSYANTRTMYTVHAMFRREFALLPELLRSVPAGDKERVPLVTSHIVLLNQLLHNHHTTEDMCLWPLLLERAPKEIDPVVRMADGHHEAIEETLIKADEQLTDWNYSTGNTGREPLAQTLQQLAVALYEHMGMEERLVLPVVERHVFASEWQEMEEHAATHIEPEVAPLVVGMLMYEAEPEAVPQDMLAIFGEMAPKAFAAHCELVHGTPTPPRTTDVVIGTPYVGVAPGAGAL
jgi:hemerythrin-like domain-containing protein